MMKTAVASDSSGEKRGVANVYHSLSPLERTAAQVGILRGVLDTAADFLHATKSPTEGVELDPEAAAAARKTAVLAFHQLDNIVDDMGRWSNDPDEAEKVSTALLKAELERVKAETRRADHAVRPSTVLRPRYLRQIETGKIVALTEDGLHAFGDTAAEAAENFDLAFFEQRHSPEPKSPPAGGKTTTTPPAPRRKTPRKPA